MSRMSDVEMDRLVAKALSDPDVVRASERIERYLVEGPRKFYFWLASEPRMDRMVGGESADDAQAKYLKYFGINRVDPTVLGVAEVDPAVAEAAARFTADPEGFLSDCLAILPFPITDAALPLLADWLDEREDDRGAAVREAAFQRKVQPRC